MTIELAFIDSRPASTNLQTHIPNQLKPIFQLVSEYWVTDSRNFLLKIGMLDALQVLWNGLEHFIVANPRFVGFF